jgi:hypothetical protein
MTSTSSHEPFELIGAFVDGERVDPEALTSALASPEGRQYLVDAVTLRELATERPLPAASAVWHERRPVSLARWAAVAAAIVVAAASGYLAGHAAPRAVASGAA